MALVSPGLSITVTDESQYISNAVGTVPLVLLATAQDKTINGSLATGTTKANAGMLQVFGSQRELSTAMGYPVFQQSSAGTPLHGNELNEYGLMAAYSALGINNQLYAVRADIDLNSLQSTSVRPTQPVADGTVWFDTADTTWGIYEWSASTQTFNEQQPMVITSASQTVSTTVPAGLSGSNAYPVFSPLSSVGTIGEYAVVNQADGNIRLWYKAGASVSSSNSLYNQWVLVGTQNWHNSNPAVTGTVNNSALSLPTTGNVFMVVNSSTVRVQCYSTNSMSNVATAINNATISGVTADVVNGYLTIYSDGTTNGNGTIIISNPGGSSALTSVGVTAGTYYTPLLQAAGSQPGSNTNGYGNFATVPYWTTSDATPAPSGSVWLKTGATGGGSNFVLKEYNATTAIWNSLAVNSYPSEVYALNALDPSGGGVNIAMGTIFMHQDPNQTSTTKFGYAGWRAKVRTVNGAVTATGNNTIPTFTNPSAFTLTATAPGTTSTNTATVSITGATAADFVAAVSRANVPYVSATVTASGAISITHSAGGQIVMTPTVNNPLSSAGFVSGVTNVTLTGTTVVVTGFANETYIIGATQPVADPANGTLWYYGDPTVVDIMINTGTAWVGYQTGVTDVRGYSLTYGTLDPSGVIVAAAKPTTQTDGTTLAAGDLWLNTSDLEHWPALSRYNGTNWVAIDNTDQITTNGILFADARWDTTGTTDPASGTEVLPITMAQSNYLDLDAPNPQLYPRGMLLFNTRRSGYNVKKYVTNYFNTSADNVPAYNSGTTYAQGAFVLSGTTIYVSLLGSNTNHTPSGSPTYWAPLQTSTWVTASGLKDDGSPYAGHYAQRQIVVAAMKSALDANTEIREDQFKFSLICAPGYPELIPDMVSLNNDRANTAFVIGDTPMGLSTNVVGLTNWSNDTNGDGLATNDPYLAVYYPGGLSTDLSGNEIMVPASHMALRTYLYNDNVAYQWFAPAGTRRGLVSNATDLGYVDHTTGEFVRTGVNQALRDALYQLRINPITIIPGIGLVVWGQKTRDPNTESMDRVNVARLVNYIRTIFASAGNAFLFEPNDKITRDQFASVLNRALNDLVAKRGIYDYLVVCDTTNNTPDRIANNQLYADVAIEPTKDVEFIYIPIRLFNPGDIASLGSK